jgi:hypothetical protein
MSTVMFFHFLIYYFYILADFCRNVILVQKICHGIQNESIGHSELASKNIRVNGSVKGIVTI